MNYKGVWCSDYEWLAVACKQHELVVEPLDSHDFDAVVQAANEYGSSHERFTPFGSEDPELGILGITSASHRHSLLKPEYLVVTDGVNCVYLREI